MRNETFWEIIESARAKVDDTVTDADEVAGMRSRFPSLSALFLPAEG